MKIAFIIIIFSKEIIITTIAKSRICTQNIITPCVGNDLSLIMYKLWHIRGKFNKFPDFFGTGI